MEVKGKIIQKFDPVGGKSKTGNNWTKQEYLLETIDAVPRKVFFDFFGERANQYPLEVGDIESREYNGRWYTNIRGWKAEKISAATAQPAPQPAAQDTVMAGASAAPEYNAPAAPLPDFSQSQDSSDDLPF